MKIKIECFGKELTLFYDKDGYIQYATDKDGEYVTVEQKTKGIGYAIKEESSMIGDCTSVCDARYVRLMGTDFDFFAPKFLFIRNIKK